MAKIQVRRGTKAQLDGLTSGNYLDAGEVGFTTDTHEVFVGTGTTLPMYLIGGVQFDVFASRPAAGVAGRIFHATDTNDTYLDDGTVWNIFAATSLGDLTGDLDDIADGTTYGKVLNTELTSGQVNQIDDGTNNVTAAQARTHIDDVSIHRELNDAGSSSIELWSADKIATEIAAVVTGIDPQESVLSQLNLVTSEPAVPSIGDRYINTATGTSSETSQSVTIHNIYEWNGTNWTEIVASEGMYTWVEDEDISYIFDNTNWVKFGSTVTHNNLSTLQGGTTNEYYHLTAAENTVVGNTSGTNTGDQVAGDFDHGSLTGLEGGGVGEYNHVTDAELVVIGNTSGTNTGDQTVSDTTSIDLTLAAGDITADLILADGGSF